MRWSGDITSVVQELVLPTTTTKSATEFKLVLHWNQRDKVAQV
jgi:hypothetical protein